VLHFNRPVPFKMPTRSGIVYHPQSEPPVMSEVAVEAPENPVFDGAIGPLAPAGDGDDGNASAVDPDDFPEVLPPPHVVVVPAASGAPTSYAAMMDRRPALPKDSIRLLKFKGDSDIATLEDFLFQLDIYFDAVPGTYDYTVNPNALKHRFVVVVGCFPPGSVAAVWFRSMYKAGKFESWSVFLELLYEKFQRHSANLVSLQNRWGHAAQRRAQSAYEYYAFLLKLQASIAAVGWEHRPSHTTLLTKFCASVRSDLQRFLQEKRIDHPDYSIHQLVQIAGVRETTLRAPAPRLDLFNGRGADSTQKYCFFCKPNTHSAEECRKIAAKKARGEWKERPLVPKKQFLVLCCRGHCVPEGSPGGDCMPEGSGC
jgi:hypothetical protein